MLGCSKWGEKSWENCVEESAKGSFYAFLFADNCWIIIVVMREDYLPGTKGRVVPRNSTIVDTKLWSWIMVLMNVEH